MNEWLTPAEAAQHAKCHPETVRVALRLGQLTGVQKGSHGRWRTKRDWIDAWIIGEESVAA